jgi:hypothetical protein
MSTSAIENAGKTAEKHGETPVGSAVESCPLHACELKTLKIEGSNKKRKGYFLEVKKPKLVDSSQISKTPMPQWYFFLLARPDAIQVISKSKMPQVLTLTFSGSCAQGRPGVSAISTDFKQDKRDNTGNCCPTVLVYGPDVHVDQPSKLKLRVYPKKTDFLKLGDGGLLDFLKKFFWDHKVDPNVYFVKSRKHSGYGDLTAEIQVFPEFEIEGKITLGWKWSSDPHKRATLLSKNHGKGVTTAIVDKSGFFIEGEISGKQDYREFKYSAEYSRSKEVEHYQIGNDFCAGLRDSLASALNFFDSVKSMNLSNLADPKKTKYKQKNYDVVINAPKLSFAVSAKLVEAQGKPYVEPQGKFEFEASLISVKVTVDIIDLLLKATGGPGPFLQYLRERAETASDRNNLKIELLFTADGDIFGNFARTKISKNVNWLSEGAFGGKVALGAHGKAEVNLEVYWVKVTAGARFDIAGAESADKGASVGAQMKYEEEEEEIPNPYAPGTLTTKVGKWSGNLFGSGLAIYYQVYHHVGKAKTIEDKKKESIEKNGTNRELSDDDSPHFETELEANKENKTIDSEDKFILI